MSKTQPSALKDKELGQVPSLQSGKHPPLRTLICKLDVHGWGQCVLLPVFVLEGGVDALVVITFT